MTKWEFQFVSLHLGDSDTQSKLDAAMAERQKAMNTLGCDGWEPFGVIDYTYYSAVFSSNDYVLERRPVLMFKRALPD